MHYMWPRTLPAFRDREIHPLLTLLQHTAFPSWCTACSELNSRKSSVVGWSLGRRTIANTRLGGEVFHRHIHPPWAAPGLSPGEFPNSPVRFFADATRVRVSDNLTLHGCYEQVKRKNEKFRVFASYRLASVSAGNHRSSTNPGESGRVDLNHRPLAPHASALAKLRHAPKRTIIVVRDIRVDKFFLEIIREREQARQSPCRCSGCRGRTDN